MAEQIQPTPARTLDKDGVIAALQERLPGAVKPDDRKGYEGIVVDRDKLVDVAEAIRDDFGYDYLSSATAVDYHGISDHMEMVYHAFRVPEGGPALVFKAQT